MIQKLFRKPLLVTSQNSTLFLPKITDYKFAQSVTFLPISASEVIEAQKCYPIFFLREQNDVIPFVAMGVQEDKNIFIDAQGKVKDDCYVPAIMRAYPFSITKIEDKFSLVMDEQSLHDYPGDKKLFTKSGNLTKEAKKVLDIVEAVYADLYETKQALGVLSEKNLLKSVDITINTPKKEYILEGILIVDEEKVKNLDDTTIADFYKRGILDIIVLHIASLSNIARLGRMAVDG